jgi:hypothetical protein
MINQLLAFAGSWILFLGAIYQATVEMGEHQHVRRRLEAVALGVAAPPEISRWWWLLPPLRIVLVRLRANKIHRAFIEAVSFDDFEALITLVNKFRGWLFVASGTYVLAVKETLPFGHAALIIAGATGVCAALVAALLFASKHMLEHKRPNRADS